MRPLRKFTQKYHVFEAPTPDRRLSQAGVCRKLAERRILLEICPSSNLHTQVVKDLPQLAEYIAVFRKHNVRFSFNTDGPEMLQTTLREELRMLIGAGVVSRDELARCGDWAREASFIGRSDQ